MGSRKGMRAQESQARANGELSGAGAGFREADPAGEPVKQPPPKTPADDKSRSTLATGPGRESDDIGAFEDDEKTDEENDLA